MRARVALGTFDTLEVHRVGHVGWLVLNRPETLNAMSIRMLDELPGAWAALDADPDVRAIVVTGAGRGFCTGVDVKELANSPEGMKVHAEKVKANKLGITSLHNRVWKPVIAAVNGVCAGGGLHFVADSDIVVAASDAEFLDPHVSVGQVSSWEPIGLLRKGVPFDAVARMLLVGRAEVLDAAEARRVGMVGEVVDPPEDLRERCQSLGEQIATNSPGAMMVSKKVLWESLEHGLDDALANGARALAAFWRHPDAMEGPQAHDAGRTPVWGPPVGPDELDWEVPR